MSTTERQPVQLAQIESIIDEIERHTETEERVRRRTNQLLMKSLVVGLRLQLARRVVEDPETIDRVHALEQRWRDAAVRLDTGWRDRGSDA